MARLFFRLKLTLLGRGLRGGGRGQGLRVVSFVLGGLFGLFMAVEGFAILTFGGHQEKLHDPLPVAVFTILFVGWLLIPLLGWGLDETLDPTRLALLPLSARQLMSGLLVASAVGIAPAATLVALFGALAGYATIGAGTAVIVVAIGLEFVLCLVGARALTTALSRILRSRRARDLWAAFVSVIGLVVALLGQLPRLVHRGPDEASLARFGSVLRWLPPGMLGRAVADAGRGHVAVSALELVPAVVLIALLARWWSTGMQRLMTTVEQPVVVAVSTSRPAVVDDLFGRLGRILPRDRRGAVAAKDLRYLGRDPIQRVQRLMSLVYALGAAVFLVVLALRHREPSLVLATAVIAWWLAMPAMTMFGFDRSAYWMNAAVGGDPADDLMGKTAAVSLAVVPVFLVAAVVVAAICGGWLYLPLAACLALAVLGARLGVGGVISVRLARPVPESRTNMWAARSGQGCGTVLIMMGALFLDQLLLTPVLALVVAGLVVWKPLLFVAAPASVAYGALLYRTGFRMAARWIRAHQPELLEALSPRQAA